ncbi:MAG: ATP-binding protein [Armatimonadota bacterium]
MSFSKLPIRLQTYVAAQVLLLAPVLWAALRQPQAVDGITAVVLLLASFIAGTWKVQLTILRGKQSLVFAVVCLAFLLQPAWVAMACAALGATSTHLIRRDAEGRFRWVVQPMYRRVFNGAHCALVSGAAALGAWTAAPLLPAGELGLLCGVLLFTAVYFCLNTLGVATAIALEQEQPPLEVWREHYLWTAPAYFGCAAAAAGVWGTYLLTGPAALLLLPCLFLGFRGYTAYIETVRREREMAEKVARLYEAEEEANRRKDQFLAMLAHELRNPLASITNAHYVLDRRLQNDPELSRYLGVIGRQSHHLKRLVDDLLDVSRITRGVVELRPEVVDLRDVLRSALDTAHPLVQAGDHQLRELICSTPVPARVDRVRVEQVFSNLLTNAAKYTPAGGRIEVRLERDGGQAVLTVKDNGVGISPELLPKVFELFVQADESLAHSQGGLGIGLTLVKSLLELHGGRVEVRSEGPGRGSEFRAYLPLAQSPEPAPSVSRSDGSGDRRLKVLVVEDNVDAAETLAEMLEMWGYRPCVARTGSEGLTVARSEQPDLAIVDIGLPGVDGYEVARRLRQERGAELRLIALTGYGQERDVAAAREAGFDLHLVKPAAPEEIRRALEETRSFAACGA